jgi:hypothetical protein
MATKAQLAKAALKSAALISKSNDAFKPSKIDHLLRSCARLGFTLLITATSIQAQTLALTEGYSDPTPLTSVRKTPTPRQTLQIFNKGNPCYHRKVCYFLWRIQIQT